MEELADIKKDRIEYSLLLRNIKSYIKRTQEMLLEDEILQEGNILLRIIEREERLDFLMSKRKLCYDFYIKNKNIDPDSANKMYQQYLYTKHEIEQIRKER